MRLFRRLAAAAVLLLSASQGAPAQGPLATPADTSFFEGNWKLARERFMTILAANPGNVTAHVKAGYAELKLDNAKAAQEHFEAVIATAPQSGAPLAQGGLAIALARMGKLQASLERLESAVKVGYYSFDAIDAEKAFGPLRRDPRFVAARQRAEINAYPCLGDSAARAFDFWIGEWDVYLTGTSLRVGFNKIERVAGGCAILENWTATSTPLSGPSDGKSLNFHDPVSGEWRQVWMGSGKGQNNYEHGKYADNAMRFTFERNNAQGVHMVGRFTFFNLGPNRVRQFQEASRDSGATYSTVYDFTYVRRGSGESPLR